MLVFFPFLVGLLALSAAAGDVPSWPSTYNMSRSTVFMPCNFSGSFDPQVAARWGLADFDWSNSKADWANAKPMDCEERLVAQATSVKALDNSTRVFVYRNLVKALPWYTSVREKLEDPQFSGWFLKFKDGVNGSYSTNPCTDGKCSEFYHDQDQTPEHPSGDGNCVDECDCGSVPCGEYLWDHRNESLREWLVNDFVMGTNGVGHSDVDGLYLDDSWADSPETPADWWPDEGYCSADEVGGPTEEYPNCTVDMGLTQSDTTLLKSEWEKTIGQVHAAVLAAGGFTWQQFKTVQTPVSGDATRCASWFRDSCAADSPVQRTAVMFEFTDPRTQPLTSLQEDLAHFLLVRGPYAWLGYGWIGCVGGGTDESLYMRPDELDEDYGEPHGLCVEDPDQAGLFTREWTKANVSFDCNSWKGTVILKQGE